MASLVALLLVATLTDAIFLLLSSFVGALGDVLHLSAIRTGLLADLTGIALTTGSSSVSSAQAPPLGWDCGSGECGR